jgi:hypothetical protein
MGAAAYRDRHINALFRLLRERWKGDYVPSLLPYGSRHPRYGWVGA